MLPNQFIQKLNTGINRLESILLPSFCLNCRAETPEEPVSLRWLCLGCHGLLKPNWTKGALTPEVDGAYHIFNYQTDILAKKLIYALKYELVKEIASAIAVALQKESAHLRRLIRVNRIDFIVPLPLHWRRLRDRGFNQSRLIAEEVAHIGGIGVRDGLLTRKLGLRPQAKIKRRDQRLANIKNAFRVADAQGAGGRVILLVDDVTTTGATLREAARAIKAAGAAKVFAFTLAQD
ncbi:MAG: phosphoribosyltransferase family protein [Patescibacteria group bacterium]